MSNTTPHPATTNTCSSNNIATNDPAAAHPHLSLQTALIAALQQGKNLNPEAVDHSLPIDAARCGSSEGQLLALLNDTMQLIDTPVDEHPSTVQDTLHEDLPQ